MIDTYRGWVDPATRRYPVTPASRFDLASLTKTFTTTAILQCISEGLIGLDTSLAEIIPEFAEASPRSIDGGQDPHTRERLPVAPELDGQQVAPHQVTIRHLLTHTSGLAPWRDVFNEAGPVPPPPNEIDPLSIQERWRKGFAAIYQYPFVDIPGEHIHYSDLGFLLLGQVLVRLEEREATLDQVIQRRILDLLALETLGYNPLASGIALHDIVPTEIDHLWRKRRVWGEVHDENACGLGGVAGHAGLFGTARDIATFGRAWLNNAEALRIDDALLDETKSEQVATNEERRGYGWLMIPDEMPPPAPSFSSASFGHTGFTGTMLMMDPTRQLVVCILTNRVYPGRDKPGIREFRWEMLNIIAEGIDRECM